MATSSGAADLANELLPDLIAGKDFSFPDVDFDDPQFEIPVEDPTDPIWSTITKLTNEDLTTRQVDGTGTFDILMTTAKRHIKDEYDAGRITGNDYVKAYLELTATVLSGAVQFLLSRDSAFWQAALVQQQAQAAQIAVVTARVQLETSKAQLAIARVQASTAEVEYALTKLKLSTEDAGYANVVAQKALISEQTEAARAQTLDTRTDGTQVVGSVGKQKDLYVQQIDSYKRDSEVKAAKIYSDAWITMKTIDEGVLPPASFQNANLDVILNHIQDNNGLS